MAQRDSIQLTPRGDGQAEIPEKPPKLAQPYPNASRSSCFTDRAAFGVKSAGRVNIVNMKDLKCGNCGENCLDEPGQPEDQTRLPIHFFVETEQVCRDCYQILLELESAG